MFLSCSWTALQSRMKGLSSSALVESAIHMLIQQMLQSLLCGGIQLVIQCLSSPVRNTVNYALGAFYYLCNPLTKKEILNPDVLMVVRQYAAAGDVNTSFSNLANAFLDKHVNS